MASETLALQHPSDEDKDKYKAILASETLALQHPSDEDNILDLAQHGSDKDGSDQDGSNSGGSDEEFDDSKNDFSTDGCNDCSSY